MPSLAKHNYVSCLMQITLPGIDNYTLYYETFVFILRVYAIMLFDYVYRCTQSSARTICTLENNYKPANERHAKHRKEKVGKEDDIRVRAYIRTHTYIYAHTYVCMRIHTDTQHAHIHTYRSTERRHYYDKERPSSYDPRGRIESKAHSRAWLHLKTASY